MYRKREKDRGNLLKVVSAELEKNPLPSNAELVLPEESGRPTVFKRYEDVSHLSHSCTQHRASEAYQHRVYTHRVYIGQPVHALVRLTPGGFLLPEGVRVVWVIGSRCRRNNDGSEQLRAGWVVERVLPDSVTELGWSEDLAAGVRIGLREIRRICQLRANLQR